MNRVLFVDDEPLILEGLRRMLRGLRNQWEMHFAESGSAALELLARTPVDVVVTDMRMPGMNGAELLTEVKRRHPEVVRIVLSGHAETDAVMTAFGIAQQYLLKPCEPNVLRATVARAFNLRRILGGAQLEKTMGSIEMLPSFSPTYYKLVNCLRSPTATLAGVARLIAQDVGMTAAIVKIVNSPYFAPEKPINTLERAVQFLGLDMIMTLVLEQGVFRTWTPDAVPALNVKRLQRESLRTAAVAHALAGHEPGFAELRDEAFLSGMFHELGKLALASGAPERYVQVVARAPVAGHRWCEVERAVLGADHAEAGAYLLGLWGFQNTIVEAVLFHVLPSRVPEPGFGLAGLIHVAVALARHPYIPDPGEPALGLEPGYLDNCGMTARWREWQEIAQQVLVEKEAA